MRLVSFRVDGRAGYGVLDGTTIADVGSVVGADFPDLQSILGEEDSLARLRAATGAARRLPLEAVELRPPIPNPAKIFCIGHNYEEHRLETGRPKTTYPSRVRAVRGQSGRARAGGLDPIGLERGRLRR